MNNTKIRIIGNTIIWNGKKMSKYLADGTLRKLPGYTNSRGWYVPATIKQQKLLGGRG